MTYPPERIEIIICSFNMICTIYYDVNKQGKVDGLVMKISNTTRPLVKIMKFLLIFELSNFSKCCEFYDVTPQMHRKSYL